MRINNINELDRDAFALILKWLSPRDWNSASQVCRLWNELAHQNNVRLAVSQNFFPWFTEKCRGDFKAVEDFIDTEELIAFLMRQDIPIACKIHRLNILKSSYLTEKHNPLFFPKTLSKQFLRDRKGDSLKPLHEFIDRLSLFLVHAFRLLMSRDQVNLVDQFNTILSNFYGKNTITHFHEHLPKELISLLESGNSQKNVTQLNDITDLANTVRPRYLRNFGMSAIPNFKPKLIFLLISSTLALSSLGVGSYILGWALDYDNDGIPIFNKRFILGLALTSLGGAGTLGVAFFGFFLHNYYVNRSAALDALERNANTDTIIEIPPEPTERTPLIPPNQRHDNIENNNNAPVFEEASAGTISEVEMQTDDDEHRFSMN